MHKKIAKAITGSLMAATMMATSAAAFVPMNADAGLCVGQVDFEEGIGLPWHTCETNPAKQHFKIENGTYNVTLDNIGGSANGGESRWDLQLRHRSLKIVSGATYTVSFDVNASTAGRLYTKIGDLSGDIEVWHNCMGMTEGPSGEHNKSGAGKGESWDPLDIQEGDNHFECTFTADQDLAVAEWAFHYGGRGQYQEGFDCFPEGTVLKFDNLKLECSSSESDWDTTNEMGYVTPRSDVRLNQVGYFTNLKKVASYATDQKIDPVKFVIKDASGKEVYSGTGTQYTGTESGGADYGSGEYVQFLDFTDFNEVGTYTIEVDDKTNIQTNRYTKENYNMYISHDFDIVDPTDKTKTNIYDGVLKNALNYYYQNRSGVPIEADYITSAGDGQSASDLAHQAGHVNDMAYIQSKWVKAYKGDGSDVEKSNGELDCTGGWYDAGDHGKYVVNGGISVWTLQNMYELSKFAGTDSKWEDGKTMSIPQKYSVGKTDLDFDGTGSPDILDEARVELAWMFKMQRSDGMVYHKMHDHKWTGLAVEPWNYAEDHVDADGNKVKGWGTIRIVKPVSTAATLNLAACAAQAARLWAPFDSTFSATCLANAKKAYEAAKADPENYAPLDQAIGGGAYGDNYVEDDFYWAACELYATTGDSTYYTDLMKYNNTASQETALNLTTHLSGGENSGSFTSFNWGCTGGLGTLSLWLYGQETGTKLSASDFQTVEKSIIKAADTYVDYADSTGMGIPYAPTTFQDPVNVGEGIDIIGYEWGSNSFVVNNAIVMAYAYKATGENKYISGVGGALDYIFGRNGQGISYVTGTGDYYTKNPHHRFWSYELDHNFPKAPDGVMSGGPGSGLQDPYVGGLGYERGKVAPQKCYVDSIEAWSVNEVTINWNAPFAWTISFLEDEIAEAPDVDDEPVTKTTASDSDVTATLWGDANCDGEVKLNDAILIMQAISNPNKFGLTGTDKDHITAQGIANGDVYENGTNLTAQDALSIQKFKLELIPELPESYKK